MFTVTGKICVLGAVFMIGLVFVWLCHVCCRSIWRVILMHLESSARFSRILELSEINRERSGILPPSGAPVTHLAFLTTYVSSPHRPPIVSSHFTRYNTRSNRLRTRQGSTTTSTSNSQCANSTVAPGHSSLRTSRVSPATNTADTARDRMQVLVRQDAHVNQTSLDNGFAVPMYLSIDSVGSEPATDIDIRQSTTLTIASANSPPPSYHSTDSIVSQPTSLQSHRDRVMREFPRQTSDSSETSIQSAPLNNSHFTPVSRRERLQKISEQHLPSTSSPSIAAAPLYSGEHSFESTSSAAACQQIHSSIVRNSSLPASDDLPPSYNELFGERT